jgi:hypothetical protein
MENLVECLRKLEASELPDADGHEDVYIRSKDHPLVVTIADMACHVFIDEDGKPLFEEMDRLLEEYGYLIFPGERDRCGWLTACIQTKKGVIVFG